MRVSGRLKSCSFCGKTETTVKLVSAPDDYDSEICICNECVKECVDIIDGETTLGTLFHSVTSATQESKSSSCSFCDKTEKQVDFLLTNHTLFICNECISLCKKILEEEEKNQV
ncbi:ClpX C4-type zinc finger protein [Desulfofundulus kuznetsovii]|uniref:ClpX C4-type zinc finger protein n=1 Tax=Desulfofundulus kuznetsovii TaxID=58135 RepID=UPI00338DF0FB